MPNKLLELLGSQGALDAAALGTSTIPIVGEATGFVADAANMIRNPDQRTLLNVGLMAAGVVPGLPSGGTAKRVASNAGESLAERLSRQGGRLRSKPGFEKIEQALESHGVHRDLEVNSVGDALRKAKRDGGAFIVDADEGIKVVDGRHKGNPTVKTFKENTSLQTLRNWLGY